MQAGDTFYFHRNIDEHLWAIISDPVNFPDAVLIVSFTSFHDRQHAAMNLVTVEGGEHPLLYKRSWVYYSRAILTPLQNLENLQRAGKLVKQVDALSPALLQRIREGGRTRLSLAHLQVLIDQGLLP